MADVAIYPLAPEDAAEILRFELENRAFFASRVPDRGDDYFSLDNVERTVAWAVAEWERGTTYMHLVRDATGELVGRINVFDVQRGPAQMAEVGYRIGERHNGKGYATTAVSLVVEEAFESHGLHRLEAATSPENIGSQIVLVKNGFQFWGRARSSFQVNGVWRDSVLFERIAGEGSGLKVDLGA